MDRDDPATSPPDDTVGAPADARPLHVIGTVGTEQGTTGPDARPTDPLAHLSALSPSALLRQLGLRPLKRLSQSFLVDRRVPETVVRAASIAPDDQVLEIGPGLGIMTRVLGRQAARVVAVELDRGLAAALTRLVPSNVQLVEGDALQIDPTDYFTGRYKIVANLPYSITSPFLLRYLDVRPAPLCIVVMIQREVAERILAASGALSYLAVAVQSTATVRLVRLVPPTAFHPRPKVESAVIRLDPLAVPLVAPERRTAFLALVRAGFTQPRKTLANSLAQGLGVPRSEVVGVLERAGIAPERRPHELALPEWRTLFEASDEMPSAVPTERT